MLSPATFFPPATPAYAETGPAAVEAASARLPRPGGRQGPPPRPPQEGRGAAPQQGVRIAGQAPSLSTDMLGTLGRLDESLRFRIDPQTGEPVEIDPLTGEPMTARPSIVDSGQPEGGADGGADGVVDGGAAANPNPNPNPNDLTPEEQAEVRRLQAIDRQVRQHEAAHKAAGIGVTGPSTFTYVTGPDGRQYAVAGEVSITVNAAPGGNPDQAIRQLEQVKRAALAPADPSPADRAAAAAAEAALAQAEQAKREQEDEAAAEEEAEAAARSAELTGAGGAVAAAGRGPGGPFAAAAAAYGNAGALGAAGAGGARPVFGLVA